eukprot:6237226-Lingulodinium_polyedra.AAC.1
MLTAQVRKWRSTGPLAGIIEEPGDGDQDDEDPDFRLPRSGRVAVWGNARVSECLACKEQAPGLLTRGRASEGGQHPE